MYFLTNVNLVVPVVAAVAVIVIAIAVICVLRHNRQPMPFPKGSVLYSKTLFLFFISERITGSGTQRKEPGSASGNESPFPGLPSWVDLNIIVPVAATVIVICVGVLVICVAVTRRKQPQMTPGWRIQTLFI